MRSYSFLILMFVSIAGPVNAQQTLSFSGVKRVLFLGNSITYEGTYVTDIDCFLRLRYPEQKIEVINAGLPSETVSGLSEPGHADNRFPRPDLRERLQRVLDLVKPDLVVASYGINDGIYLPFDETRFAAYQKGVRWLHDEIVKHGAVPVHVTGAYYDEVRGKNKGYEHTMDKYAEWVMSMKDSTGWNVIDVYHPMKEYLYAHRKVDEQYNLNGFELAKDGVHPDANAHWLMARIILVAFRENSVDTVSSIEKFVDGYRNGLKVLELVRQKQMMMKDAWLSAAGHKRPEMNKGFPLSEAKQRAVAIDKQIDSLTRSSK